ncbi:hypothetical protein ATL39_0406 [Sinobaca qinghaiensis]|jgi:hypothetical protein|uniref:Bh protein n=1 Tax=Sinobaca qinghaiensis TaxID=342944 RepID=A0A419V8B2_9BACL|nr:bh protein [Sinobaca qinghaiensis]RKD76193.1 hypothetical protein ATL39_0406 [Sinobaca qinghaiensis]
MKKNIMIGDLFCESCKEEVPHRIEYVNNEISTITCEVCDRNIQINRDMMKEFYEEIYERVSSKPHRITEEYKQDLNHFITGFPFRIVSKPYRLIKDMNQTHQILKEHREKHPRH